MKLLNLTLAGLALAVAPAFGDSITLTTTTNLDSGTQTVVNVNKGVDSVSYSYSGLNYTVDATVNFSGAAGIYTLTGSADVSIKDTAGITNPFIEINIGSEFDVPEIVDGYTVVGNVFRINTPMTDSGLTSFQVNENGPLLSFPLELATTQWSGGIGYQYMDFNLQITHVDPNPVLVNPQPAATPEPATWAMMLFPLMTRAGFKLRRQPKLQ